MPPHIVTASPNKSFYDTLILLHILLSQSSMIHHLWLWFATFHEWYTDRTWNQTPSSSDTERDMSSSKIISRHHSRPLILYSHPFTSLINVITAVISKWLLRRLLMEIMKTLFPSFICYNLEKHFPHNSVALETKATQHWFCFWLCEFGQPVSLVLQVQQCAFIQETWIIN